MKPDYKLVAKTKYIHMVSELAEELWREVYKKQYPKKQLDAVLAETLSPEAVEDRIDRDENFFMVMVGGKPVGYFAWKMHNSALYLSDLYLKPEYRGKGMGRDILLYCERLARADGKGRVFCHAHEKVLPVLGFFKAQRYRVLQPAPQLVAGYELPLVELEKHL